MNINFKDLKKKLDLEHYYELHDELEAHWITLQETEPTKVTVQALIQLSVAFHHRSKGNLKGFEILKEKALIKLKKPQSLSEGELKILIEDLLKTLF